MTVLTFFPDIDSKKACPEWFCQYVEKAEKVGIKPLYNGSEFIPITMKNKIPQLIQKVNGKIEEYPATREETVKAVYDAYTIYRQDKNK